MFTMVFLLVWMMVLMIVFSLGEWTVVKSYWFMWKIMYNTLLDIVKTQVYRTAVHLVVRSE